MKRYGVREDALAAPMIAVAFPGGGSLCLLDPAPQGDTTVEEVGFKQASVMLDERYTVGALGAHETAEGGVALSFSLPGSMEALGRFPERRRYSRIVDGVRQSYSVALRLGRDESFRDL
ncbi:MAG: hypothetical protein JXA74_00135, partial [Anaerolineae bacterium]|nr:hypothetical protein [Anaerolineae bacterium]